MREDYSTLQEQDPRMTAVEPNDSSDEEISPNDEEPLADE